MNVVIIQKDLFDAEVRRFLTESIPKHVLKFDGETFDEYKRTDRYRLIIKLESDFKKLVSTLTESKL